jgi:hypothetical protein
MYKIGQIRLFEELKFKLLAVALGVVSGLFVCVALSVMTKIGNLILGW